MSSAGQIVGGIVGAVIGFYVGGPVGALQGAALGAGVGGVLDPPKGPTVQGPRLADKGVQTSTYGASIPRIYGTIAGGGNIIQLENNKLKETVRKKKSGGKGGGGSVTTKTYTYSATFQLSLCEGPIAGVRRIWCGDKLIYNAGSDDLETIIASNKAAKGFRIYLGTDDQMPDPRYEAEYGVGNVSAHRGEAYIAFYDFQLADYSNTLQGAQFKVEVVSNQTVTAPSLFGQRTMVGQPVYSDESIIQTADNYKKEKITIGSTDYVKATLTYRTYNRSGALLTVQDKSVVKQMPPNITASAYLVYPLYGTKGQLFIYDPVNNIVDGDIAFSPAHITTFTEDTLHHKKFGEIYFIIGLGGNYYFIDKSGVVTSRASGGDYAGTEFAQDATTGRVYISYTLGDDTYIGEVSVSNGEVLWSTYILTRSSGSLSTYLSFYVDAGRALIHANTAVRLFDVSGTAAIPIGSLFSSSASARIYPYAPGFAIGFSISTQTGIIYRPDDVPSYSFEALSEVLRQEMLLSNLIRTADFNVASITSTVKGYRVTGGTIRSAIEPLQAAFPFDVRQHGYQMQFLPRGQSSVVTIPWADLGAIAGDTPGDILQQSREMDSQLPARTAIKYLDAAREYAVSEQYSERLNTEAINRVDRELPLVLTATEAARVAEVLNFLPWLERTDAAFTLPPIYRYLEPGDVVTVTAPQATYELRLTEINETPDGRLECKAKPNRAALYTSTATGAEGVPPTGTIGLGGVSLFVPLDIPTVDETIQNAIGFVGVMTGYTDGWPGGIVVRSSDGGQTWVDLQAYVGKAAVGVAVNSLPVSDCTLIDQRTLTVGMISGEPESITRDQMLAGANYAAYGLDGRWEIVRFQNATLQADDSYLLSGFVRGERGTEWATGLHAAGDYFVLLSDPDNAFIGMPVETIGLDRTYRGVTAGDSVDDATDVDFTYRGVNLECLSPVYAKGTRDGSSNFTGTFTRRSRLSSSWWTSGVVAPVGETTEAYEIDVMSGSTVKRTITASSPSFSYSAANQTTDFGSAQSSITFRIYQLSETVGRGYPLEVTL